MRNALETWTEETPLAFSFRFIFFSSMQNFLFWILDMSRIKLYGFFFPFQFLGKKTDQNHGWGYFGLPLWSFLDYDWKNGSILFLYCVLNKMSIEDLCILSKDDYKKTFFRGVPCGKFVETWTEERWIRSLMPYYVTFGISNQGSWLFFPLSLWRKSLNIKVIGKPKEALL